MRGGVFPDFSLARCPAVAILRPMLPFRCFGAFGFWFVTFPGAVAAESIAVYGAALARSAAFQQELRHEGFEAAELDDTGLAQLPASAARLVVIAADAPCPPASRLALTRFLAGRRHVIVVGAANFDYTPQPVRGVPAVDLTEASRYRILQPAGSSANARYLVEPARVTATTTPAGQPALEFRTSIRGMSDVALRFSATGVRSAQRTVLAFWARGDSYADLLAIEAVDLAGGRWIGFVPLAPEWRRHVLSLADLLPRGWRDAGQSPPQLEPDKIATLSLGLNAATIWREKPMAFSVGAIELAEEAAGRFVPTSALPALRVPFQENDTAVPSWLFDPFHGARSAGATATPLVAADTGAASGPVSAAWLCPPPEVPHPGVQMGTDTKRGSSTIAAREQRRIPLWRAATAGNEGLVGELRVLAGGPNAGACLAIFGVPPAEVARDAVLRTSLVRTAARLLRQPKIAAVTVNTTARDDHAPACPAVRVQAHNPLDRPLAARVIVNVAGGRLTGAAELALPAHGVTTGVVPLGAVPADFPFAAFPWEVALDTKVGRDVWTDTVDTERALLRALAHLVRTQRQFPDGRLSHHYFGDAYGVRGLFAYLDLVRREPERLQHHRDLWAVTDVAALRACGLRWIDMLLSRQQEDGSFPIGYGEQSSLYNIADGGSIALALGQIAPLLDERRRDACWQFCRRFGRSAESYYLDEQVAAELAAKTEKTKPSQIRAGHYGLGSARGVRNPLGPSWVLPDILGVQLLLPYVDSAGEWRRIADRNVRNYLDAGYTTTGYFHAEAFVWAWLDTPDDALRRRIAENLTRTFVPDLLTGREDDLFELGARKTLRALPMIYYRRFVADDPEVRAALLKHVWTFGAESSERSMRRLAEAHPKPHHGESLAAAKYAAFSAIWAAELLEPGATLLRVPGFPRGGVSR